MPTDSCRLMGASILIVVGFFVVIFGLAWLFAGGFGPGGWNG